MHPGEVGCGRQGALPRKGRALRWFFSRCSSIRQFLFGSGGSFGGQLLALALQDALPAAGRLLGARRPGRALDAGDGERSPQGSGALGAER